MINNKKSKILIGCLALLLVLSVGYAYFSQNITINGTATAKGDFNITPTCIPGPLENADTSILHASVLNNHGYKNETCTVNDANDTVTIKTEFEYPGAGRLYTIKMTNTGTIDAIAPESLQLNPKDKFCYTEDKDADPKTGICAESSSADSSVYAFQVGDGNIYFGGDGTPQDILNEFVQEGADDIILKPGNSLYYFVYLTIPESFTTNSGVLNAVYEAPYKATFTQSLN